MSVDREMGKWQGIRVVIYIIIQWFLEVFSVLVAMAISDSYYSDEEYPYKIRRNNC